MTVSIHERAVRKRRRRILAYRKKIHIRMDDVLHQKLRQRVANEATTIQMFITNLLERALG